MISLRFTKPCARCQQPAACMTVKRELEESVERLSWYSKAHGIKMPDVDVIVDCKAFDPKRPTTKGGEQ